MPDPNTLGTVAVIIIILAVLGVIFLRILLARFLKNVLENPSGRVVLGAFMCIGGLIFGFSSSDTLDQNHWPIGGGIAVGGLLLLLITLGIPYLNKRWEKAASANPSSQRQNWDTPVPPPPPGVHSMPMSQPGELLPPPNVPFPAGGYYPTPGIPTPQPGGTWPAPNVPYPPHSLTPPPYQG